MKIFKLYNNARFDFCWDFTVGGKSPNENHNVSNTVSEEGGDQDLHHGTDDIFSEMKKQSILEMAEDVDLATFTSVCWTREDDLRTHHHKMAQEEKLVFSRIKVSGCRRSRSASNLC